MTVYIISLPTSLLSFSSMADKPIVLKRLEAEVTCPLCLEVFTEPKRLPNCEHVLCRQCLRGLALRSTTGSISCPECRTDTPIPPNFDVSQFPTPHQVNRLIEMYQQDLKLAESEAAAPQPATCSVHHSQPLALFCETCERLVCRDCVITSCVKKNHEHGFIDDMVKKYQADLKKRLEPVKKRHELQLHTLESISKTERELEDEKQAKLRQTESTFDALAEILAQERKRFTESIKKSYEGQEESNHVKKKETSEIIGKLESVIQSTHLGESKPAFLRDMANKKRNIEQVMRLAGVSAAPTVLPEIQLKLPSPTNFGDNFYFHLIHTIKGPLNASLRLPINQTATLHCFHRLVFTWSLTTELTCCSDGSSEAVTVEKLTPEQFSLSFIPRKRGRHELHVKYKNTHIKGSPIPIYVTIDPHQLKPISSVKRENTGGIKCYGGKIYVCHLDYGVLVLNSMTKAIERVIEMVGACEVLVTQEYIYATDFLRNQVVKLNKSGTVLQSLGEEGKNPGQFDFPNGIRQSKNIYVCDTNNHRIQVIDEDLKVIRAIEAGFNKPADLDFDEPGNIYVTELENHRVQVLTPEGQHICNIGAPGSGPGELNHPVSPAISRNLLYVTDIDSNHISVFKTTGEFIAVFGEGIQRPECLAIDEDGYIHVTSNRSTIVMY